MGAALAYCVLTVGSLIDRRLAKAICLTLAGIILLISELTGDPDNLTTLMTVGSSVTIGWGLGITILAATWRDENELVG